MEDDLWLKKIKERLEDYSEPLPAGGWEWLEKELSASGTVPARPRRLLPFRRWAVAAAAVLLAAVSSVSLWLLRSPVVDELRQMPLPALAVAPDELPQRTEPAVQTRRAWVARLAGAPVVDGRTEEQPPAVVADGADAQPEEETAAEEARPEPAASAEEQEQPRREERYRPSGRDKLHLPGKRDAGREAKGWTVGLSVGNTGGLSWLGGNGNENILQNSTSGGPIYGENVDLSSTANDVVTIPGGQELVFKDGLPYLQRNRKRIADIEHKQPVSFGVAVRKNLAKGFSVESGLTYTYLASDVRYEGSSEKLSQKLHYIGIPVRANWSFVDTKEFSVYVSAGGAVEKCVYGKIGTESETVKPVQLSVTGAVGAQYNISGRVGLYVEPGVSYFFDDGSPVQTIRKENPCNFTLQAGIRLTY